ncbi:MAG: copper-binding protein [Proteobacteria bacterium]|nr:MAG: copper-binding protein [Pseudomonadota bacterium]
MRLFSVLVFGALLVSPAAFAEKFTVAMKSISFEPKRLELSVGDEVVWNNISYTEHSATADGEPAWDTGSVAPKKTSKPISFKAPGTFAYHCQVHGKTMSGTILVKAKQ